MVIEQVMAGTALHWQLARFTLVMITGLVFIRAAVIPATKFLVARRTDNIRTQTSIGNFTGIFTGFLVLIAAFQAGNFGGLVTVLGTVTAALTVAIGFGMRDEVGSLVSGIFIQVDNPFVKGDYIKVDDTEGVVQEINLRTTTLKTSGSEKMVMPNRILNASGIKNFTRGRKTKTSVNVKTPVETVDKARKILREEAEENSEVQDSPEPDTLISKIEEDKAETELHYWVSSPGKVSEVRSKILENFSEKAQDQEIFTEEKTEE